MADKPSEKDSNQTVRYPATYESLEEIRGYVAWSARQCGLMPASIYSVQLAVDEAFTNIIEHAYGGECQEEIECTCKINADRLTITLRDCGQPFNPAKVPEPDLNASLEERPSGGLGLYFMRHLMDEVKFTFIPNSESEDGCNILTMVKFKKEPT
jgi:serine/threonine-protein kinase RsbW